MKHRLARVATIAVLISIACLGSRAIAAAPMSTDELMKSQSKWDGYVKLSTRFKVEGRCTSLSPKLMRLAKCNLSFRPKESQSLPNLTGNNMSVEAEGTLEKSGPTYQFIVEVLRQAPSDEQRFQEKKVNLEVSKSEGWYELGDWALARGNFYDDATLKRLGNESYHRGIQIEYENLPKGVPQARFDLAAKGKKYGLGSEFHAEMVHEGHRLEWEALQKRKDATDADCKKLLERIEKHMPGAGEPLTTVPPDLEKNYRQSPLVAYRASDAETRMKLNRLFRNDVVLQSIERNARPDGSNGYEIAARIDEQVPEWHGRAEKFRDRELEFKLTQIPNFTQQQAVGLAEQFDTRGKADRSKQVLEKWLAERTSRVAKEDAEGMVYLAEQYELLLSDKATAVRLLLEAYGKRPESVEIAAALGLHGFTLKDGKWLSAGEAKDLPVDPLEAAIREGRVSKGMTREQVTRALGKPTSATRIATGAGISEVWVYREKGVNRVTVHFQRIRGRNAGDARVVASF